MASPKGRFVGLVDASGSGGVRIGKSDAWSLVVHLANITAVIANAENVTTLRGVPHGDGQPIVVHFEQREFPCVWKPGKCSAKSTKLSGPAPEAAIR